MQTFIKPLTDSQAQTNFVAFAAQFAQTEAKMKEVFDTLDNHCQTEE